MDPLRRTYVFTYQREEVKTESLTSIHKNLEAEKPQMLPEWLTIDRPDFCAELAQYAYRATDLFKSKGLTPTLWFTENAILTGKTNNTSLKENYLKPLYYLLVLKNHTEWNAFALADLDTEFFQGQLKKLTQSKYQIALLDGDGELVQNGQGTSAFSSEERKNLFVQDIVIDLALTHCHLSHVRRFRERLEHWHDFWPMWNQIKNSQPQMSSTIEISYVENHIPAHIREYKQPANSFATGVYNLLFGSTKKS